MTAPAPTPSTTFAFSPGARGYIIADLQRTMGLEPTGLYDAALAKRLEDRDFSRVDSVAWGALAAGRLEFPSANERAASFLGGLDGFNFDTVVGGGPGVRIGILGFDIRTGSMIEVLRRMPTAMIDKLAGNAARALHELLDQPEARNAWALDYSQTGRLLLPVGEGLGRVLAAPASRRIQLELVRERWAETLIEVGIAGSVLLGENDTARMRSRLLVFTAMIWDGMGEDARWKLPAHYSKPILSVTHHGAMLEFARRAKTVHQDRMLMIVRGSGHCGGRAVRLSDAGV